MFRIIKNTIIIIVVTVVSKSIITATRTENIIITIHLSTVIVVTHADRSRQRRLINTITCCVNRRRDCTWTHVTKDTARRCECSRTIRYTTKYILGRLCLLLLGRQNT